MQDPTNTVAASKSHESGHSVKPKKKPGDSAQKVKVRCVSVDLIRLGPTVESDLDSVP